MSSIHRLALALIKLTLLFQVVVPTQLVTFMESFTMDLYLRYGVNVKEIVRGTVGPITGTTCKPI